MSDHDFSDFRPDPCGWMWYSDNLSQADVDRLPLGKEFWCLFAPVANYSKWTLKFMRVKKMVEIEAIRKQTGRGFYRGYVVIKTVELEQAPLELTQEKLVA